MILKNGVAVSDKEVVDGLKELVKKKIAAFAVPTAFLVCVVEKLSSVLQNVPARNTVIVIVETTAPPGTLA